MKKIFVPLSWLAVGAVGVQAAAVSGLTKLETSKPWSISATLRGFYDDNYTTRPKPFDEDTWGFEVSPSVAYNLILDRSTISMGYTYGLKYYEDSSETDQYHQLFAKLSHAFNNRFKVDLGDTFVVAQEPEILEDNGPITFPLRSEGDNMRNTAFIEFLMQWTELFGTQIGYSNRIYDYEENGTASHSALLDRMENIAHIDLRWRALPRTIAILGYEFGDYHYDADQFLAVGAPFRSDDRDKQTHRFYLGADQNFNSNLNGKIRVGVEQVEYDKFGSETSPYIDGSLTYNYRPNSFLQAGLRHGHNATDATGLLLAGVSPILDAESTAVYGRLTHQIFPKLLGSVLAQYQYSEFQSDSSFLDGETEDLFLVGVTLSYQINNYLSAETGYNYDRLSSDLRDRSFTRNRVFIGLRATY